MHICGTFKCFLYSVILFSILLFFYNNIMRYINVTYATVYKCMYTLT